MRQKSKLHTLDGTPISRFAFGTMQWGGKADHDDSRRMFEAAREHGINVFDTAVSYTDGHSEALLGEFVKENREEVFIATKCAWPLPASRATITAQFQQSLTRLRTEQVDLLYLHRWCDQTPLEESFETLASFVEDKQVRYIGVSNYSAWQVMKAQRVASEFGLSIAMLQPMYSLVKRQVEVEVLPMSISEGFGVMPYSPLGGGLLTGKYDGGASGRITDDAAYKLRYGQGWMHKAAVGLSDIAAELGVSPITLAVAWVAKHPGITAPIISASRFEQLQPSLDAISFQLDQPLYDRIAALVPTPAPATDRSEET